MAVEVILPKVDMVMETGTFAEWLKQEGEQVVKAGIDSRQDAEQDERDHDR